jgi:hypothetical protein
MKILKSGGDYSAKLYELQNGDTIYGVMHLVKQKELRVCIGDVIVTDADILNKISEFLELA